MAADTAERGAVRVFLVRDDSVARASLCTALAAFGDIEVVGECSSRSRPIDRIEAEAAKVVILDCDLAGDILVELGRALKAHRAHIGVLLHGAVVRGQLRLAIDIADGLILGETPIAELVQGIRDVHRGRPAVDRRLWPALFSDDMKSDR